MSGFLKEPFVEIYHSIIEHNPDAIFVFTVDGKVKEVNPVVTQVFGYSKKEMEGTHYRDLVVPEQIDKTNYYFRQGLQGLSFEGKISVFHKNGEAIPLQVKGIPLTIQNKIIGIFCVAKDLTDLLNTQSYLSQMEERFKSIFHSSVDAIDLIDLDGNIIDVNRGFENLYGWKKEEVAGKPLPIIPPSRTDEAKAIFEKAKRGEHTRGIEVDAIKKDGTQITISLTFSPVHNKKGKIVALSGIARDITHQNQLELSLKESEDRYKKLIEYSPTGVLVHKKDTILYANPSALKILGEQNLIEKPFSSYIHADNREIYKHRVSNGEKGLELPFTEMKVIRRDGNVIFAELGGVLINYDGAPTILTLFRDISERKRTERALKESEKLYRLLADNSLDLIQLVNLDGIVTYASPSHKTVLGYDPEEYKGKWVFHQPHGEIDEEFKSAFFHMALTQKPVTFEIVRKHKQGYNVWVELMGTPMFDKEGNIQHMMLVGRNITERKEYEKQLEYLSFHDTLTGLPNRRLFKGRLELAMKESKRYGRKFAVLYMDIDYFKKINDTFGHDVGDDLLTQFSIKVRSHLRESDTIARLGGDEFAILLSDIQEDADALKTAERILSSLQEPWIIGSNTFHTTSSIGISLYPKDGTTRYLLMKHADIALYKAKESGKNTINMYSLLGNKF